MKKFLALLMLLTGCGSVRTEEYADVKPVLDIRQYLNGPLEARGILFDRAGKADLSFYVTMKGTWTGNDGTLEEHFTYSDGRTDQRIWHITFTDAHRFTATAGDVIGSAEGTQYGNAVRMQYTLNAKRANGETITLSMDDRMYLLDGGVLINRTQMSKFGLNVGELVISFRKL